MSNRTAVPTNAVRTDNPSRPPAIRSDEDDETLFARLFPPRSRSTVTTEDVDGSEEDGDDNLIDEAFVAAKLGLKRPVPVVVLPTLPASQDQLPLTVELSFDEEFDDNESLNVETGELTERLPEPGAKKQGRSILNSLLVIGHLLVLNVMSIPVTAYIIRRLDATAYGQWSAASLLVTLASLATTLGLRPLFVRQVAQDPDVAEEALAYQLGLRMVLTTIAALSAVGIALALRYSHIVMVCVVIAVVSMILNVLAGALADLLQGLHRMKAYSAINFVAGSSLTVASVFAAYKDGGPVGIAISYMVGPAVSLCFLWAAVQRRHFPVRFRFSARKFKELLHDSKTIAAYQISIVLRDRLEHLLLPTLTGMKKFGFYSAGTMPADRLFVVPEGFITAYFPAISKLHATNEDESREQIKQLFITSIVCCAPLAILVTYLAEPMSAILFPKDPMLCTRIMEITIWAVVLRGVQLPMGCALQASGRHSTAAKTGIAATVVSLILTLALILQFKMEGAYWSWLVRTGVSSMFLLPHFMKHFPGVLPRIPLIRIMLGLGAMEAVVYYFPMLHLNKVAGYLGGSTAALVIYVAFMFLLRVISIGEFKRLLRRGAAH